jgi:hypothetical protein
MASFREYTPEQAYLLPSTVREVLGEGHPCFFVHGAAGKLDLQEPKPGYNVEWHPASHPVKRPRFESLRTLRLCAKSFSPLSNSFRCHTYDIPGVPQHFLFWNFSRPPRTACVLSISDCQPPSTQRPPRPVGSPITSHELPITIHSTRVSGKLFPSLLRIYLQMPDPHLLHHPLHRAGKEALVHA